MASARSDGLGLLDRLVILVAWLLSCGVVFVIGYYVGKDAVPSANVTTPAGIEVPVAGLTERAADPRDGGTFYESLGRQTGALAEPGVGIGRAAPTTARPVGTTTSTVSIVTTTVAARRPTTTETMAPRPTTTRPPAPTTTVTLRPTTTRPTTSPPAAGGRRWTVYVSPTRDRFAAERQRAVLRAAGYDASVVGVQRDGDVWYRVRAGSFESEAAAEAARRDLRERGIGHAFVQSE